MSRPSPAPEPDATVALPLILVAVLSGGLLTSTRVFEGAVLTVARVVMFVTLLATVAWTSHRLGWWRTDGDGI